MDRRTFLKATTLSGASLALSGEILSGLARAQPAVTSGKIPTRVLGKTGVSLPILALGGIDWTTNQSLLRMAFKMGLSHWDAASSYENGRCEMGIGEYFAKYPEERKDVFLVTKASHATRPEEMTPLLAQSLERLQTDYIDLYFIHMLQDPSALTSELKAWAEARKKEGKIRFFGFSTHASMAKMMMAGAEKGWIDAIMTTYNYQVMEDEDVKRGMDALEKAGVGFIAMKSQGARFGGGGSGDLSAMQHFMDRGYTLEQAKLRAVWADERVTALLSKISNLTILKDNVAAAKDEKALSALDRVVLENLAEESCGFYCRACMRCASFLPAEIRVPDILRYMMYYNSYGEKHEARLLFRQIPEEIRNTLSFVDFAAAEAVCPNHIKIGSMVREAVGKLGT